MYGCSLYVKASKLILTFTKSLDMFKRPAYIEAAEMFAKLSCVRLLPFKGHFAPVADSREVIIEGVADKMKTHIMNHFPFALYFYFKYTLGIRTLDMSWRSV